LQRPLVTGAQMISTMANLEGEETFEASFLGQAEEVVQERICDDELILIKGPKVRTAASLVLRGANDFMCDEMERSVHDALCVVKVSRSWWRCSRSSIFHLPREFCIISKADVILSFVLSFCKQDN